MPLVSFGDPPRGGVAQLRSLAAPFSGYEERFINLVELKVEAVGLAHWARLA